MKKDEDFFESWSPTASWSAIWMISVMALQHGWTIKGADFDNAFVQAPLNRDVYVELPAMFKDTSGLGAKDVCLKCKKSLCGMVDSPRNWWLHISAGLDHIGFTPSANDPGIWFGHGMVLILYVDDILLVGPDESEMSEIFKNLKKIGFELTPNYHADGAFHFLGIEVKMGEDTIQFCQHGLIKKLLETMGMTECNAKTTPARTTPLGTDATGPSFNESWKCASVVGMMMHSAANAHPETQFAVHQLAQFTHCPKNSHAQAAKRVCKCFQHVLEKQGGLTFC